MPLQQVEDAPTTNYIPTQLNDIGVPRTDTWVITDDAILVNPKEPVILQPKNENMNVRLMAFLANIEKGLQHSLTTAAQISDWCLKELNSPSGQSIEDVITALVPDAEQAKAVIAMVKEAMGIIGSTPFTPDYTKAILQRLGAKIVQLLHGGKFPNGISDYITIFEELFKTK